MLHGVIMAGGSGTRFWPASRRDYPKQFLRLTGERSLLQATRDRCHPWIPPERLWVVTSERLAEETARQLPEIPREQILAEPCPRNTAPCVGLAAVRMIARDPDATMLVLPADHAIESADQFRAGAQRAAALIEREPRQLVLFGVRPSFAATGYGYVERGAARADDPAAYAVESFREKPDEATASRYVASGRFYWNCGIFCWRATRILEALRTHEPTMQEPLAELAAAADSPSWSTTLTREFPRLKSISIDYAVLERDATRCVLEAPFGWDDVGSWQALPRLRGGDGDGNTADGLHLGLRTRDCVIRSTADHLIATLGVSRLVIVHTPDATLVAQQGEEEAIKQLVEQLAARGLERFQ